MPDARPRALRLYQGATRAGAPLAGAVLRWRAARGKEDPRRWTERLGRPGRPRPEGLLAWLHGVSVGESLALLPLATRLIAEPGVVVLVTSGTRASAEVLADRLPPGALHQYAPVDTPTAARRFLDHWRPALAVFVESELWPNLILAAAERTIATALVSASLSERSCRRWMRAPTSARLLLTTFDLLLAKDDAQADRFRSLGARVDGLADLKFGSRPLPVAEPDLAAARRDLGGRPVIVAASTHAGEEEIIVSAFAAAMAGSDPPALLVIAPRHPSRGPEIARLVAGRGLAPTLRSRGGVLGESGVHIADTLGEMGLWYRLADLAVMGGSLLFGMAGHNPLEAARLGCPFIVGPHVSGWAIYADLISDGATRRVEAAGFGAALQALCADHSARARMADRALVFVAERDAVAASAIERVTRLVIR